MSAGSFAASGSNITAGFVDLATYDELEKFLYGGATATAYFVKQVRKSTWFTIVPVVLSRYGNSQFGSAFYVSISRAGDYLLRSWIRVQTPTISITWTSANLPVSSWLITDQLCIRWTRNFMHNLIKEATLSFNDLVEQRFDNFFLDFWSAFTIPAGKRNGYQNMIGNFEEMTNPFIFGNQGTPTSSTYTSTISSQILNLPLPFSHFRESGLALPTAALPYNEMKITAVFRNWYELLIVDNFTQGTSTNWPSSLLPNNNAVPQLQADIWAEYALVSNMERVQMGKNARDIVIEQVQTAPAQGFSATTTSGTTNVINIHFAHAIKALFFSVQNITNTSEWSNYTSASPVPRIFSSGKGGVIFSPALATDPVNAVSLFYESTLRLSNMGVDYFSLLQPFYTAVSIPLETGYHLYSYTMDLLSTNPLGSTDYGKLTNVQLMLSASSDAQTAATVTGSLTSPNTTVYAGEGAPFPQVFQTILCGLNHNIVRIAGGALGFPVL